MRKIYSILLCVLCLSAVGCSDDKDTADVALKAKMCIRDSLNSPKIISVNFQYN